MNFAGASVNNPSIERAFRLIPSCLHEHLKCDWFLGSNPIGVLEPGGTFTDQPWRADTMAETPHCSYSWNQTLLPSAKRRTTVVLPGSARVGPYTVVHELGHVLHEKASWVKGFRQVSQYAGINPYECFAEAFSCYLMPWRDWDAQLSADDVLWFDRLIECPADLLDLFTC